MQNPFDKLNQIENKMNQAGNQVRSPMGQVQARKDNIQRTINQGTSNMVGALSYVTGVVALIALYKKEWKEDSNVRYHAAHARVIWIAIIVMSCSVIGLPVAGALWLAGFFLASQAVSGQRTRVPFLTNILYSRKWIT